MVGATAIEIKRKALEEGMLTLRMSGLEKIKAGTTTVEEVLRETVLSATERRAGPALVVGQSGRR